MSSAQLRIPPVARTTFEQLVREPLLSVAELREQLASHIVQIEATDPNVQVDKELGLAIARTCEQLIDQLGDDSDEERRRLVQAAVRYFVLDDDGDSDLAAIGGLDDDAAVCSAVASYLGRQDLELDF
jgi:hypothetical protein